MTENKKLSTQIDEIIDCQIKENNPIETKLTRNRLRTIGYNEQQAKALIGQCVIIEMMDIMKNGKEFNEVRFVNNLKNLPVKPQ